MKKKDVIALLKISLFSTKGDWLELVSEALLIQSRGKSGGHVFWPHQSSDTSTTPCHLEKHSVKKGMGNYPKIKGLKESCHHFSLGDEKMRRGEESCVGEEEPLQNRF